VRLNGNEILSQQLLLQIHYECTQQKAKLNGAIYELPAKTREAVAHKGILRNKTKISIAVSVTVVALILATLHLLPHHHNTQVIGVEPAPYAADIRYNGSGRLFLSSTTSW
jgi:hypothetical protein